MRQRSRPAVPDDAAVIENLLKLGRCGMAVKRKLLPQFVTDRIQSVGA